MTVVLDAPKGVAQGIIVRLRDIDTGRADLAVAHESPEPAAGRSDYAEDMLEIARMDELVRTSAIGFFLSLFNPYLLVMAFKLILSMPPISDEHKEEARAYYAERKEHFTHLFQRVYGN